MTEKELREIEEQLREVEARAQGLSPLAETAEDSEIEAREKELAEIEETRSELLKKKEELEATLRAAAAVEENPNSATEIKPEERGNKMDVKELRDSPEYIDAYAKAIRGDDTALRSLLTENAVSDGQIPIPTFAEERIKTAWDSDEVLSRVSKTYLKGNVKIGFEISGTDAVIHAEGSGAIEEEELTIGVAELIPQTVKKYITISSEVEDMKSQEFIDYVYDELGHRIAKKAADTIVGIIAALPQVATSTTPSAGLLKAAPSATVCVEAIAQLSDEARGNVVILNKATWATFKSITTGDGYPLQDPFAGMEPIFNDTLPAYATASEDDVYAIVGDLNSGFRANFPNGQEIKYIYDALSLAEADLIKIVGRMFVALAPIACGRFCLLTKPE